MKRKPLSYIIIISILLFVSCSTMQRASRKNVVVLPLGGEVKVTEGSLVYALPLTVFEIDVIAERTIEIPGPYATYASEMLGLTNVITSEGESWSISGVTLNTQEELDPSQFYVIQGTTFMQTNALALKKAGLILDINPDIYDSKSFSHSQEMSDYSGLFFPDMGADEYMSTESDTAYKIVKADTAFIRIPYLVQMKKTPSLEEEASAAATKLLELREGKHLILTGETNVFPQDAASINEINRLDKEYTALFAGKTWSEKRHFRFWFTPEMSMIGSKTLLFGFSGSEGVKAPDNNRGEAVYIEMVPSNKTKDLNLFVRPVTSQKEIALSDRIYYRVPDVADIRITKGNMTLCTARKLIYQFGNTVALPANFIIGK